MMIVSSELIQRIHTLTARAGLSQREKLVREGFKIQKKKYEFFHTSPGGRGVVRGHFSYFSTGF